MNKPFYHQGNAHSLLPTVGTVMPAAQTPMCEELVALLAEHAVGKETSAVSPFRDCNELSPVMNFLAQGHEWWPLSNDWSVWEYKGLVISVQLGTTQRVIMTPEIPTPPRLAMVVLGPKSLLDISLCPILLSLVSSTLSMVPEDSRF